MATGSTKAAKIGGGVGAKLARDLIAAVKKGQIVVTPSWVIFELDDEEGKVRQTAGTVVTHPTFEQAEQRLRSWTNRADSANRIRVVEMEDRGQLLDEIEAHTARWMKENGMTKMRNAAKDKGSGSNGSQPKATATVWPEVPEIKQPVSDELVSIKTSTVQLAESPYAVRVKRDKEKGEEFTALLDGKPITVKSRAHKVIRAVYPYHASKRRRGYDVDAATAQITAKPNGEPTERKAPGSGNGRKRELVVPEGWSKMVGADLKAGMLVYDLGGGARDGSVPEREGTVEVVHHAHMQPDEYMFLRLGPQGSKEPTRKKYLSGKKEIVARKATKGNGKAAPKPKAKKGNGKTTNGNGKTTKAEPEPKAEPKTEPEVVAPATTTEAPVSEEVSA